MVIVIQQLAHEQYTRKGDNLMMKLNIGLTEALCGFKIPIKHLDGRELIISHPQGKIIEPGELIMSEKKESFCCFNFRLRWSIYSTIRSISFII